MDFPHQLSPPPASNYNNVYLTDLVVKVRQESDELRRYANEAFRYSEELYRELAAERVRSEQANRVLQILDSARTMSSGQDSSSTQTTDILLTQDVFTAQLAHIIAKYEEKLAKVKEQRDKAERDNKYLQNQIAMEAPKNQRITALFRDSTIGSIGPGYFFRQSHHHIHPLNIQNSAHFRNQMTEATENNGQVDRAPKQHRVSSDRINPTNATVDFVASSNSTPGDSLTTYSQTQTVHHSPFVGSQS